MIKGLVTTLLALVVGSEVYAKSEPLALIYKGPGSCVETSVSTGCSEAAAHVARAAGFRVEFVRTQLPQNLKLFAEAQVWIQPGGRARIQIAEMSNSLKDKIREFVARGGGYVGFCAGGFLASESFGWDTKEGPYEAVGLGLIPGESRYYELFDGELNDSLLAKIFSVSWLGQSRNIYWELGPYFNEQDVLRLSEGEIVAKYPEQIWQGKPFAPVLSLRGKYHSGRVYVTAVHPEAPQDWRDYYHLKDPDGLDIVFAKEMVLWASGR